MRWTHLSDSGLHLFDLFIPSPSLPSLVVAHLYSSVLYTIKISPATKATAFSNAFIQRKYQQDIVSLLLTFRSESGHRADSIHTREFEGALCLCKLILNLCKQRHCLGTHPNVNCRVQAWRAERNADGATQSCPCKTLQTIRVYTGYTEVNYIE